VLWPGGALRPGGAGHGLPGGARGGPREAARGGAQDGCGARTFQPFRDRRGL